MAVSKSGALRACFPRAIRVSLLLATLGLGACAMQHAPPAAQTGEPDPALQGHAQWCNTNPPSGYCGIEDHR